MANKPLQSIKFPDLPDTYIIPVVDSTLAVSGAAADAKQTGDSLADKVDKVSGKGLSTNDYTDGEKTKLAGIETGATKTIIDSTLTVTGNAADAKAVGDAIANDDKKALAAFATDTASGSIASFPDGADSIPMKDVLVHIEPVQAGSGDPSPDNVRPITGWTGAKVTRTGKNLLPSYAIGQQRTENGITATANADGSITYVGTSTGTFWGLGDSASIWVKAGTYTLSARNNTDISINIVNAVTGSLIDRVTGSDSKVITFANDKKIYYITTILSGKTIDTTATYQLELGSTATDYEPYHADTYDITFPTEAGTVYGGTLDVTSGVLTVTHKLYTFDGSENWTAGNYGLRYEFNLAGLPDYIKTWNSGGRGLSNIGICDPTAYNTPDKNYITSRTNVGANAIGVKNHVLVVPPSVATTVEEFKAFLANTPEQWYAPLQTPQTYQLTPQEITSLLGENNLWADTGDSDVEYRADTKMYVDAKVAAAVSALS